MHIWLLIGAILAPAAPLDFDTDILPVLSKSGCNAAACHGAADGRGGFKLSLFAGDPAADYAAIARERAGRRVNFVSPADSLLVTKPSGGLEHGGGLRFDDDSEAAQLLVEWIEQGAERLGQRQVTKIAVMPGELQVATVPTTSAAPIAIVASYNNIADARDVTRWATITADDPESIEITSDYRVRVKRPGRHLVVVRYLSFVQVIPVLAPLSTKPIDQELYTERTPLDTQLRRVLEPLCIVPAPEADDRTLVRRLYLDLTGRLPTVTQTKSYLGDKSPTKYAELVDKLLGSDAFSDYWAYRIGKQLRMASVGDGAAEKVWRAWLHEQIAQRRPWDQTAKAMIAASGDSRSPSGAAANFHRVAGDARLEAEYVTEALLGVRLRCANCHNHPFDHWTQADYHGLAAIFAKLERAAIVRWIERGEVSNPATGEAAPPRLPGERDLVARENAPVVLADWLTAPENPYFAKAMANRVWAALIGRGLVEPIDDLRDTNPGDHPAALDYLTQRFIELKYDLRGLIREIVLSSAYRRGGAQAPIDGTERYFARALAKPLSAEVWFDAVHDVTQNEHTDRAINRLGVRPVSERLLGGCSRGADCEDGEIGTGGLAQRLKLVNGSINDLIVASVQGRRRETNASIVEDYYWRAFARAPSYQEAAYWLQQLDATEEDARTEQLEDFLWAILNSREFTTSH